MYQTDRLTYFALVEATLGKQPNIRNPDRFGPSDPLGDVELFN